MALSEEPPPAEAPGVQLNLNVRGLAPSATIAINERSRALARQGRTVFRLGLGQSPFPVPEPVGRALARHAFEKDYLPVQGLEELREAIAAHHRRQFGIETSPANVLVGPGSKELMFLLQLVYYGEIVIPTPGWVSYAPQARILGRTITFVPTAAERGFRLDARTLDGICRRDPTRPRILVLNYPSNPTGLTYGAAELEAIAEVARRYRVVVLSDEIYGKLHHRGEHRSIVPAYPEGTIFSGGLSKWCGAGGWRLGLFVVPERMRWLLEAMAAVASETFTSTSAPIQYAAVRAFEGGPAIDAYLRDVRRILAALGRRLARTLRAAGARVADPEGGFYLFPDFGPLAEPLRRAGVATSGTLAERLLEETGVAVLPGSDFGRPAEELTVRIAYVDFDGARALAAARTLPPDAAIEDDFVMRYCGRTVEAVERLAAWVDERAARR